MQFTCECMMHFKAFLLMLTQLSILSTCILQAAEAIIPFLLEIYSKAFYLIIFVSAEENTLVI